MLVHVQSELSCRPNVKVNAMPMVNCSVITHCQDTGTSHKLKWTFSSRISSYFFSIQALKHWKMLFCIVKKLQHAAMLSCLKESPSSGVPRDVITSRTNQIARSGHAHSTDFPQLSKLLGIEGCFKTWCTENMASLSYLRSFSEIRRIVKPEKGS
jgi:hypothetical protein